LGLGVTPFTFADLFAGIGGFRLGMSSVGGECVYSVEYDVKAIETYEANFGRDERRAADIRDVVRSIKAGSSSVPSHHVLCAGFPCQPFSLAGVSKKVSLGRKHGFEDESQGSLFFDLATIIATSRPPVVLLENVKNLKTHDKGRTFKVIEGTLRDIGYSVSTNVVDAAHWVPQHRERVFLICLRTDLFGPEPFGLPTDLPESREFELADVLGQEPAESKYRLSNRLWAYLQSYAAKHRLAGNGFGYGLVTPNSIQSRSVTRTLSARYFKDGAEILIQDLGEGLPPRRLTPAEAARLMGFPSTFAVHKSDAAAYKQLGNAVIPLVVGWIAKSLDESGVLGTAVSGIPNFLPAKHDSQLALTEVAA
jgi:DNA (cytosine-5)-methyltransferase 1